MDYEAVVRDVVRYPMRGDHALRRVLVGGGLMIATAVALFGGGILALLALDAGSGALGILLALFALAVPTVTGTVFQGYVIRVMRTTLDGRRELPPWSNPVDLFVDGMWALTVVLVYQAAIFALYVVVYVLFFLVVILGAAGTGGDGGGGALVGALAVAYPVFMLLSIAVSILVGYFSVVSLVTYAHQGSVRAALSPSRIRRVAFTKEFAVTFLLGYVGVTVVANVAGLLVFVLVGFFVLFAVQMALFRTFAIGYAGALDFDLDDDGDAGRSGSSGRYRRADYGHTD